MAYAVKLAWKENLESNPFIWGNRNYHCLNSETKALFESCSVHVYAVLGSKSESINTQVFPNLNCHCKLWSYAQIQCFSYDNEQRFTLLSATTDAGDAFRSNK
jgi:hypothetical protein